MRVRGRGTHLRSERDVNILVGTLVSWSGACAWRGSRRSLSAAPRKRAQVGERCVDKGLALRICDGSDVGTQALSRGGAAHQDAARGRGDRADPRAWEQSGVGGVSQNGFQMAAHPASHCDGAPLAQLLGSAVANQQHNVSASPMESFHSCQTQVGSFSTCTACSVELVGHRHQVRLADHLLA